MPACATLPIMTAPPSRAGHLRAITFNMRRHQAGLAAKFVGQDTAVGCMNVHESGGSTGGPVMQFVVAGSPCPGRTAASWKRSFSPCLAGSLRSLEREARGRVAMTRTAVRGIVTRSVHHFAVRRRRRPACRQRDASGKGGFKLGDEFLLAFRVELADFGVEQADVGR